jgi:hypothetical protein
MDSQQKIRLLPLIKPSVSAIVILHFIIFIPDGTTVEIEITFSVAQQLRYCAMHSAPSLFKTPNQSL